jgi:phospho-N-acetylmuramoyl-pentapeptide-transferase
MALFLFNFKANSYLIITVLMMIVSGFFGMFDDLLGFKVKEYQKVVRNAGEEPVQIGQLLLEPGEEARVQHLKLKKIMLKLLKKSIN